MGNLLILPIFFVFFPLTLWWVNIMAGASGGHLLVPKALRLIKYAVEKTGRLIREKVPQATKSYEAHVEPAYARASQRQPVSRINQIRQAQSSRYYSTKHAIDTTVRHYSSHSGASRPTRASYPTSRTAARVGRSTGRAPFASTLRPSLTGGSLCRSAGGYGLGGGRVGGARYFSHSPAAPVQVVSNVSQAVRAFWLSGQKARFDGATRTGEKRFRAVSSLQEDARHTMDMSPVNAPGSFIDFKVSPTITAVGPLSSVPRSQSASSCDYEMERQTLNNPIMMSNLAVDFARALKDLAAIMNDLKHLATLGDLPISLHDSSTLRVRFPGCDADTARSQSPNGFEVIDDAMGPNPWISSPSGYSSLHESESYGDDGDVAGMYFLQPDKAKVSGRRTDSAAENGYEGLQGIYRFLEQCDRARS